MDSSQEYWKVEDYGLNSVMLLARQSPLLVWLWTIIFGLGGYVAAFLSIWDAGWMIWSSFWFLFVLIVFPNVVWLLRTVLKLQDRVEQLEAKLADNDPAVGGDKQDGA